MLELKKGGISMKKDDFTEEELKAIYRDFLENDIEPAADSVHEAYRVKEGSITYPRDEQEFIHQWLDALDDPDEADEIQGMATVEAINRAYYAGLEAGRREKTL